MLADADGQFLGLLESQGMHVFFRYAHGYVIAQCWVRWTGKQRPLGTKRPHATFIIKSILSPIWVFLDTLVFSYHLELFQVSPWHTRLWVCMQTFNVSCPSFISGIKKKIP